MHADQLIEALTQEEWLDRYDLIEDDWYYNPSASDDGSALGDAEWQNDLHEEL